MRKNIISVCLLGFSTAYANNLPNLSESQILANYDGVVGDAPKQETISNAGASIEFTPNANQYYAYFAQVLSNGIYYEGRLYASNNYLSSLPLVTVPVSGVSNPWGYGVTVKLGYNFHISEDAEITPYLRMNAYENMGLVYADNLGDNINSRTYSYFIGSKLAFRATPKLTPYVDIFGGYQTNSLQAALPSGPIKIQSINANVNQWAVTYEIGMAGKLSEHISIIPYLQYITQQNQLDQNALNTINQGGLGLNPLTVTQQAYGLKLNVAW